MLFTLLPPLSVSGCFIQARQAGQDLQFTCREVWTGMISPRGVHLKDRALLLKSFKEGLSLTPGWLGGLGADDGTA